MGQHKSLKKQVLEQFQSNGHRSFRAKEIAKRLDLTDNDDYRQCRQLIEDLHNDGRLKSVGGNRYTYRSKDDIRREKSVGKQPPAEKKASKGEIPHQLEGKLTVHPDGYGFVDVENFEEDFFVRERNMETALDGDFVKIGIVAPRKGDKRRQAEVLEVIERGRTEAVGTYRKSGKFSLVAPDDRRLTHDIYVDPDGDVKADDGDKVLVSIDTYDHRGAAPQGRLLSILGRADDPEIQTLAIAMSMGVRPEFGKAAIDEARGISVDLSDDTIGAREDFRGETVFTIDPEDAKDFDDALHVKDIGHGRYEIGVHIADVSHYVRPGTALDESAREKATSVYLVDRVLPMLPEEISNNICSLRPDEDRLAFSCILDVDSHGEVGKIRVTESVIRSKHRLSYREAQAIIEGRRPGHELEKTIQQLDGMAKSIRAARFEDGSIDFDLPEIKIVLDDEGKPVDIIPRPRFAANKLIEEFMLLANRHVAMEFGDNKRFPFVFRVHEHPNREKITELSKYVKIFGHDLPHKNGEVDPRKLNALLRSIEDTPQEPIIEMAALRSMAKAVYAVENVGHFGLHFSHYTHFTSPIRRYPDLLVHRLVKHQLIHGKGNKPPMPKGELADLCDHCSEQEQTAVQAERESVSLKQVEYVKKHVGETFSGVISGVSKFGVFVELDELLVEGLVHVRDMDNDFYEYDESTYSLVGQRSGKKYQLGDTVTVRIAGANEQKREIDFVFV